MDLDKLKNPLDDSHLAEINDALAVLVETRKAIDKAKRAGIDMTSQEIAAKDAEDKLRQIKQVYFPNR